MNDNFRHVLIAEDDPDDRALIGDALIDAGFHAPDYVKDGQELLDYLERADSNGDQTRFPIRPSLILIDLNMPRVDGLAAIRQIRSDPRFRGLPLVVLSTSNAPEEIRRAYEDGASSYIVKPSHYQALVDIMRAIDQYWFKTASLPKPP